MRKLLSKSKRFFQKKDNDGNWHRRTVYKAIIMTRLARISVDKQNKPTGHNIVVKKRAPIVPALRMQIGYWQVKKRSRLRSSFQSGDSHPLCGRRLSSLQMIRCVYACGAVA